MDTWTNSSLGSAAWTSGSGDSQWETASDGNGLYLSSFNGDTWADMTMNWTQLNATWSDLE